MNPFIVVSTSGGKDSTATLLLALERVPKDSIFPVFADTGNEHPLVYEYLDYLETKLGLKIIRLKRDLSHEWWTHRDFVRDKMVEKLVKGQKATEKSEAIEPIPLAEAETIKARILPVFEKGPTGNPYLDLCIVKGRFPSRMAQFCTQFLKTHVLREFAYGLVDKRPVESWQGIRADESPIRAKYPERENEGAFWIYRPILSWTVAQVFAQHKKHGVEPNPLYKLGMGRVGCMPCINAKKDEILEISKRFPEHLERIAEWEKIVAQTSRRGWATFFAHEEMADDPNLRPTVWDDVEWSKTSRGGRQYDLLRAQEPEGCSSGYGLCERGPE